MSDRKLQLNSTEFLSHYWQQKPCLIKQAWPAFDDRIEPEILAGLAMEDGVDARIIANQNDRWLVEHGPFDDYERFGEKDWTLLVQSVNEWWPQVDELLKHFRFLPDWRVDDVMVSFATPGGGVGAHLDQYDVFIIQGDGQRHWRVGARGEYTQSRPHPDLQQLDGEFTAVIDAVLEAGDMLYIPAGCPHHGVALTPSLNYSVGFRAPTQVEFATAVYDMLADDDELGLRYRDPALTDFGDHYQVGSSQLAALLAFMQQPMTSDLREHAMMRVLSQC